MINQLLCNIVLIVIFVFGYGGIEVQAIFDLNYQFDFADDITDNIFIRIYSQNKYTSYKYKAALQLVESKYFNLSRPSIFYFHGWTESSERESTRSIVSSYMMSEREWNVIVYDYSNLVNEKVYEDGNETSSLMNYMLKLIPFQDMCRGYFSSTKNATRIGSAIGTYMSQLVEEYGVNPDGIHLVGHSLGAQIAGFVAKTYQNFTSRRIPRITALDPAGPIFMLNMFNIPKLTRDDADMVDVIHTDPDFLGYPFDTGHVDYYPNSHLLKTIQPGCPNFNDLSSIGFCSHQRAWQYYSESVRHPHAFPSSKCYNKYAFLVNLCENVTSYMGFLPPKKEGRYFLETASKPPFGRELFGINLNYTILNFNEALTE